MNLLTTLATPRMSHRSPDGTVWKRTLAGWVMTIGDRVYIARRHGAGWAVLNRWGGVDLSYAPTLRAAARRLRRRAEEA